MTRARDAYLDMPERANRAPHKHGGFRIKARIRELVVARSQLTTEPGNAMGAFGVSLVEKRTSTGRLLGQPPSPLQHRNEPVVGASQHRSFMRQPPWKRKRPGRLGVDRPRHPPIGPSRFRSQMAMAEDAAAVMSHGFPNIAAARIRWAPGLARRG
jgi:hypothetical protein